MNLLSAESVSKTYSDRWLFKDLNIGISRGEKLAMVGENGVGKSTLLKILTGEVATDSGSVSIRDGIKLGYLTQQPLVAGHLTIKDIIFDEKNEIAHVVGQYEQCLENPDTSPELMQSVLERMEELKAWDYESKVKEVLGKLGLTDLSKPFSSLSGGQRKRVFMAQMLLSEPDLMIMDEPTNHLDLEAIEWLETYLNGQMITLIMVTHDRYFLDNVANEILELDRGKLFRYKGNYAYFLEKKSEREEILKSEVAKAKNLLKKELEWMRRQPKARGTKAKYRIDAFHDLKEKASVSLKKDKLELDVKEARQGGKVIELHNISKGYGEHLLVKGFSYVFKKKDRIGVVGKNGVGKSTFLNLLTGKIQPDSGEIAPGITTTIGYFTQETENLKPANRVIEEVKQIAEFITLADGSQISASKFLEMFLFSPEKQYTFVEKLSGGEKKRLQLLKVLIKNPNFLVLDEPTNDFDIDTLNVLEDFLEKFNGCLVLVSHDRYFMDKLVEHLFVFEGNGVIIDFNGNYSDYRDEQEERLKQPLARPLIKNQPDTGNEKKKKAGFREMKEYETLQEEIARLEQKREALTKRLNDSGTDYNEVASLAKEIEGLNALIDAGTMRWLELSEVIG